MANMFLPGPKPIQYMGFALELRKAIYPWPNTREHSEIDPRVKGLQTQKNNELPLPQSSIEHSGFSNVQGRRRTDGIVITNLDAERYDKGLENIILPFIPPEIKINPDSIYVAIKPIGRNTYDYHYIGSEDIMEFEIDWFSMSGDPNFVIEHCRKVEALSKSDGYKNPPPRVKIIWGANDILFKDRVFQVLKAPYQISNFKTGYYDANKNFINANMLPHQAVQTITLARVASASLTHAMILK